MQVVLRDCRLMLKRVDGKSTVKIKFKLNASQNLKAWKLLMKIQ